MSLEAVAVGPVKAWVEPDRWAFVRAFPLRALGFLGAALVSAALAFVVHPGFWILGAALLLRHLMAEAVLRELWREGMLHPACVIAHGRLATLVRLDGQRGPQDAVVVSAVPRRFRGGYAPWGGVRAAVVISGNPPHLSPLSVDLANGDLERGKMATERLPAAQWDALEEALSQLRGPLEPGIHPVQLGEEPWYGRLREIEQQGSLPDYVSHSQATAWCAGLPCVEEPAMAPRERDRVRALWRGALRRAATGVALSLLLIFVSFAALSLDGPTPRTPGAAGYTVAPLAVAVVALSLLLLPLALLGSMRALRLAALYARDLAARRVRRFLGRLSSFDSLALDADLALLLRRGLFVADSGAEQDMTVLPVSQQVLHVNGRWADRELRVRIEEVAPPPEEPMKVALPEEVQSERNEEVAVARRRFTALERDELLRHSGALRPAGAVFWLCSLLAASSALALGQTGLHFSMQTAAAAIAVVAWLVVALSWLGRRRLAQRLADDAELGWVVTVDAAAPGELADELPARGVETLLHARLDWTVNRRPATWRRFGPRSAD